MDANRQVFRDNRAAARTHLGCVARINGDDRSSGPFCLLLGQPHYLAPRSIRDALVHAAPVVGLHGLNVQILEGDDLKFVHPLAAQLVCKVGATVGNALMNMLDSPPRLGAFWRAFIALRQTALRSSKRLRVYAKETGIGDLFARAQGGEVCEAHIYADGLRCCQQRLRLNHAGEAGIPVAHGVPSDGERLDLALDGAVQFNLHDADLRQAQTLIIQQRETALGIGETVIAILTTKARVARFLARLHAPEEGLKSQVHTHAGILQRLRVGVTEKGVFRFPFGQHPYGIIERHGALFFLPSILARLQSLVVCPTTSIQRFLHGCALCSRGENPVFERFLHGPIVPYCVAVSNAQTAPYIHCH